MSESEREIFIKECFAYDKVLRRDGHFVCLEALQSARSAKTLNPRSGKVSITDGPYAETKEQLLGFYIIEVENLEEGLTFARELAVANPGGAYELRPIMLYNPGTPLEAR